MRLDWLADDLRAAGLTVVEHAGWKARSLRSFEAFQPVGIIDHHTAGSAVLTDYPDPPFYRDAALEDKCNITIRPNGVVVVVNAGWAADSGYGDREVLDAVTHNRAAPKPTDTYRSLSPVRPGGSNPGILGNAWFIDIEVQHVGDGSPIHSPQRAALITTNAVICRRLGWDPRYRVIGHREWTKRKIDPRWDGKHTDPMPEIRADTIRTLEDDMVDRNTTVDEGSPTLAGDFEKAREAGIFTEHTKPGKLLTADELAAFMNRAGVLEPDDAKTWTKKQITAIAVAAGGVAGVTIDQVFEAIRAALGG